MSMEEATDPYPDYITGTGQVLTNIHKMNAECRIFGCCIHNPTDPNKDWPTHYRGDNGIMERMCPHGVGHPDQDAVAYFERLGKGGYGIHGCDGCCGIK